MILDELKRPRRASAALCSWRLFCEKARSQSPGWRASFRWGHVAEASFTATDAAEADAAEADEDDGGADGTEPGSPRLAGVSGVVPLCFLLLCCACCSLARGLARTWAIAITSVANNLDALSSAAAASSAASALVAVGLAAWAAAWAAVASTWADTCNSDVRESEHDAAASAAVAAYGWVALCTRTAEVVAAAAVRGPSFPIIGKATWQ